jgi:uncharacterized protein DUF4328
VTTDTEAPRLAGNFRAMTGTEPGALDGAHALDRLAGVLTVALALAGLASLATAAALLLRARAIDRAAAETTTLLAVLDADQFVRAAYGANALLTIGTGLVFVFWQYRFTANADLLADHPLPLGPGWAVGGWFVPVANLVLPFLQLRQAARVSGPVPRIVPAWTACFIGGAVLFTGSTALRDGYAPLLPRGLIDVATADVVAAAAMLGYTAAAPLAIMMVRTLTERQQTVLGHTG